MQLTGLLLLLLLLFIKGFPCLLESPGTFCKISSPENDFGTGKSWKFKLKVLEFAGMQTQCRHEIFPSAHLWFG